MLKTNAKLQDILKKHNFDLEQNNNMIILVYVSTYKIRHDISVCERNSTIDDFIKAIDNYYESIDLTDIVESLYEEDLATNYKKQNPDLTTLDIENSFDEYTTSLNHLVQDLWINCPRVDEHLKHLRI